MKDPIEISLRDLVAAIYESCTGNRYEGDFNAEIKAVAEAICSKT